MTGSNIAMSTDGATNKFFPAVVLLFNVKVIVISIYGSGQHSYLTTCLFIGEDRSSNSGLGWNVVISTSGLRDVRLSYKIYKNHSVFELFNASMYKSIIVELILKLVICHKYNNTNQNHKQNSIKKCVSKDTI